MRHLGERSIRSEYHGLVLVGLESATPADLIDDEQITAFGGQFGTAVLQHTTECIPSLCSEPHHELFPGPGRTEFSEDVRGALEGEFEGARGAPVALGFLNLALVHVDWSIVGDGSHHDQHVRGLRVLKHGGAQLLCGPDRHEVDTGWLRQYDIGRYERDRCTARRG